MHIAILDNPAGLSRYVEEVLRTWGLAACKFVAPQDVASLDSRTAPVLILPAGSEAAEADAAAFAQRGGTIIAFNPGETLAGAGGLKRGAALDMPRGFAFSGWAPAWWSGEEFPVTGFGVELAPTESAEVLAYLNRHGTSAGRVPGLLRVALGQGTLLVYALNLPRSLLLARQGDPANYDRVGPGDGCCRPLYLAADLGPHQSAWCPFTDLLARSLVDVIRAHTPGSAPLPLLWHLPADAKSILLYSGDEDTAPISDNEDEFAAVSSFGGRMNLYIIPEETHSTRADTERYAQQHDLGPHPNLRPLDGKPVAERLESLERQIEVFTGKFGLTPRTLRQHCTAWAGYLEPVEVFERRGIRMEGNYFNFMLFGDRAVKPYEPFGTAMPTRFCDPSSGRMYEVFQQPGQVMDDCWFSTADYSMRLSPRAFEPIIARMFDDAAGRFHTPIAVCIHPWAWTRYSRPQGTELMRAASIRGVPIWSFDQWCDWWDARDTWRVTAWEWDGKVLRCELRGEKVMKGLALMLPGKWSVGGPLEAREVVRYRETWTAVGVPENVIQVRVDAAPAP